MNSHKNTDPLVSICIPVYNSEKTIGKTIESLIGQTYKNIEIIVVDNLSTDATLGHVRDFRDSRIRIVENPVHFCCAENNWNTCFIHTHGELIAIFHADDVYSLDTIARQVDIFRKYPSVSGVFTQGFAIDEFDRVIDTFTLPNKISGNTPYTYRDLFPVLLEYGDFFLTPSAMINGEIYKKLAPFRYDLFGSASDFDMWLRVARTGPIIIIDEKMLKYRISKTQGSFFLKSRTHEADGFKVLDFHIKENGTVCNLSSDTIGKYELRRMEDQIFCSLNYLKKHDFTGFRQYLEHMKWGKYFRIILAKPHISLPILIKGFFKMPNNLIS